MKKWLFISADDLPLELRSRYSQNTITAALLAETVRHLENTNRDYTYHSVIITPQFTTFVMRKVSIFTAFGRSVLLPSTS